jgi:hypothetical protein
MQLFIVQSDGEVHEIKSDKPIKELLDPTQCYIVNDDILHVVYLWKGENTNVRSKFIGAQKSQDVRGQVGMNYKVNPIDQGDEPKEFLDGIVNPPGTGFAKEIRESMELKFEIGGGPSKPRVYQSVSGFNDNVQQTGPMYTGSESITRESESGGKKEQSKEILNKIIETLDGDGIPDGYEREMVIMGDTAYSVAEKVQTFLGKKQVERVLEPISSLPEGIFLANDYTPRVLVQNQTVVAIEFLKKKN